MRFKDENGNLDPVSGWASIHDPLNIFGGSSKPDADLGPAPANPGDPTFDSILGSDGQLLQQYLLKAFPDVKFSSNIDELKQQLAAISVNPEALNKLRAIGLSDDSSPWAKLQLEQETADRGKNMGDAAALADAGLAKGFSALSTHGGASAGQRASLAKQAAQNLLTGRQNVGFAGDKARNQIMSQDESNKLDILKALPGMEVQALQPELQKTSLWSQMADSEANRQQSLDLNNRAYQTDVQKTNLANMLSGVNAQNAFNMDKYKQQMTNYASYQTAKATQKSGKK